MKYSSFTMKGFKKRSWIIGICTILLIFALLFYFFTGDDQQKKKRQREECHNGKPVEQTCFRFGREQP